MRKGFDPKQARDKYGRWTAGQLGDAMAKRFGGVHNAQKHPEGKIMAESFYRAQEREMGSNARAARMQGTADKPKSTNPRDVAWAAAIREGGPAGEANYITANMGKFTPKELRQVLNADILSPEQEDKVKSHLADRQLMALAGKRTGRSSSIAKQRQREAAAGPSSREQQFRALARSRGPQAIPTHHTSLAETEARVRADSQRLLHGRGIANSRWREPGLPVASPPKGGWPENPTSQYLAAATNPELRGMWKAAESIRPQSARVALRERIVAELNQREKKGYHPRTGGW